MLDAFATASEEIPGDPNIRKSRLGELEDDDGSSHKRRRVDQEGEDAEDDHDMESKRRSKRPNQQGSDISEGSDSEGNTWHTGYVDGDDDSELDSDEAFGEGDDEKFAQFSFRGSRGNQAAANDNLLDSDNDSDADEDGLGEDAVDLAQMLDDHSDDEAAAEDAASQDDDSDSSEQAQEDSFSDSPASEDEATNRTKLKKLGALVSSIQPEDASNRLTTAEQHEHRLPTAAGPIASEKFDITDLLASNDDPKIGKLAKVVGNVPKRLKKDPKLAPALPRAQQSKLDRIAANAVAKKTLERWVPSVTHIRRAENLTFPLANAEGKSRKATEHVLPAITTKPLNSLEEAMNGILRESGLAVDESEDEEDRVSNDRTLPENRLSTDEVLARRAELRRAREILFYEERRAKRIKKIKSKTYRRIHRKERARLAALGHNVDDDEDLDPEDRELQDRLRAKERIISKHRRSKWATEMKRSGRTVWDSEVRSGVVEMAQRNEELRRRINGETVHGGSEESDISLSDDDSQSDGETNPFERTEKELKQVMDTEDGSQHSKLMSIPFIKYAQEGQKRMNEETVRHIVKELDGTLSESDDGIVGRKQFGPGVGKESAKHDDEHRNEFEEAADDSEEEFGGFEDLPAATFKANVKVVDEEKRAAPNRKASRKQKMSQTTEQPSNSSTERESHSAPDGDGWITVSYERERDSSHSDGGEELDQRPSQAEILRRAFAGDDVEESFEKEKQEIIADEDEKVVDETLPGWGSWVGEGISRREKRKNKGKVVRKQEGIKPKNRKDFTLKNVIINQKRVKKNVDYLASSLPFPFTNRAEYERSIRMPIGGEWNVKKSFVENTKPRIIVKHGSIVLPMEKPIV
jgi:U3 small nucleolar RNA-associated protein 14